MADVIGPCSTLPGHRSAPPDGVMCDEHPGRPALARIQGETDSFGAELYDLCQECLDEFNKHAHEDREGACDWCGHEAKDLRPRRDFDEGMCGRVYKVCGECVRKENERLTHERYEWAEWED